MPKIIAQSYSGFLLTSFAHTAGGILSISQTAAVENTTKVVAAMGVIDYHEDKIVAGRHRVLANRCAQAM
jgi:hypothetical protein